MGKDRRAVCGGLVVEVEERLARHGAGGVGQLGMAHHQMGQPPRLGCLGMCTGQCAVVDVNSKCWRNMLEPGWALEARRKASEARRRELEGA